MTRWHGMVVAVAEDTHSAQAGSNQSTRRDGVLHLLGGHTPCPEDCPPGHASRGVSSNATAWGPRAWGPQALRAEPQLPPHALPKSQGSGKLTFPGLHHQAAPRGSTGALAVLDPQPPPVWALCAASLDSSLREARV